MGNYINLLFNLAQIAAILDFTQNTMSKNTFCPHHYMSGIPEKPFGRHPNHESLYSVEIISIHCLTLHKWRPFHLSLYTGPSLNPNVFLLPGDLKNANYVKTSM